MPLDSNHCAPTCGLPLQVTSSHTSDGATRLVVTGELDHQTSELLEQALDAAIAHGPSVIELHCGGLSFCDAAGINAVLAAHRRLAGGEGRLRLVDPPARLRQLLTIVGAGHLLAD